MKRRQDMKMVLNKNKLIKPMIICCLCAKIGKENEFILVSGTQGKMNKLPEKIINYTPFKVDTENKMQQHICNNCILKLNHWDYFIQTCIDAQNKIGISSTVSTEIIQDKNCISTTSEAMVCDTVSEKQCSSLMKTNLEKNEFLSSRKTELEKSNQTEILKKNGNEDLHIKKYENISLPSRSAGNIYCIARWCGKSTKVPGISLFRLPKDKERAHLWLKNAEREDLKDLSSEILHTKYLCMEHFSDDMFMNSSKKKLVWNAVPTHFLKPKYALKNESQTSSLQNNIVFPAQLIFISGSHSSIKQRAIKPKPLNVDQKESIEQNKCTNKTGTSINVENSEMTSSASEPNNSANIKKTLISTSSSSEKNKAETVLEDLNLTKTKLKTGVNDLQDLKQDKEQFLSISNTDVSKKDDSSVPSSDKKIISENYSLMSDESYLNCDAESMCLEHAFRETNERIYPCRYCGEMFLVKSNLILHQTTYHSDRPVGCDSCGRVLYKSRSEFMEHVCDRHTDNTHSNDNS